LEAALDLSFDRLLMMIETNSIYIINSCNLMEVILLCLHIQNRH